MVNTKMVLQNQGCRNHPFFKIVIMKDQGNLRGRYIEHVGYWIPRETKSLRRTIILNKNRVKYWLGVGTLPSEKVQIFLSLFKMFPAPLFKWGKGNLYQRPEKPIREQTYIQTDNLGCLQSKYDLYRQQQQENIFQQKLDIANEVSREINFESVNSQYNQFDYGDRTKKFYALKQKLDEIVILIKLKEKNLNDQDQQKRQNLIKEMRELAQLGIGENIYQEVSQDQLYEFDEKQFQIIQENEQLNKNKKMIFLNYLQNLDSKVKEFEESTDLFQPVKDMDQFKLIISKEGIKNVNMELQSQIEQIFVDAKLRNQLPTKLDAIRFAKREEVDNTHIYKLVTKEFKKENLIIFPSKNPINPFPEISKWDPEDYYDVKKIQEVSQLDYNQAYDLPNIDSNKVKKDYKDINMTKFKNTMGRKKTKYFSTYNKIQYMINIQSIIKDNS